MTQCTHVQCQNQQRCNLLICGPPVDATGCLEETIPYVGQFVSPRISVQVWLERPDVDGLPYTSFPISISPIQNIHIVIDGDVVPGPAVEV